MDFEIALTIVGLLIAIVGSYALFVSVWLMVKYVKFNRQDNSAGLTGEQRSAHKRHHSCIPRAYLLCTSNTCSRSGQLVLKQKVIS